jgi:hypothetical protein
MANGDVVRVPRIDDRVRNRVVVNGHVFTPGAQGFTDGLTLEQALRRFYADFLEPLKFGDEVRLQTPHGPETIEVVAIRYLALGP